MTRAIWRQIYGVAVWNVFVIAMLILFGKYFWGLDFSKNDEFYSTESATDGQATPKCVMYTIVFETFVFLQIFNEFNCRCIQPKKLNMFAHLYQSPLFCLVVVGTFAMTMFFVEFCGQMVRVTPLTSTEHAACILWGASTLIISTILKLTPAHWVEKLPIFLDENKEIDPNDRMMAAYNAQASAKAINTDAKVAP